MAAATGCAKSTPEFDADVAWSYLVKQCEFGPRVPGSAAHDSTVQFIAGRLRDAGVEVSLQRFELDDPYGDGKLRLVNVVGRFAAERRRRILLGAHFDSRPWADQERVDSLRSRPVPGANDGASGVAILLAVADVLGETSPPEVGVDLVFFDGEDYGKSMDLDYYLLGSKHYVENLGEPRPECGILLDLVGGTGAKIRKEGYSLAHAPELTDELFRRAERLRLDVFVPSPNQSYYDDHVPFLRAGIPMTDLIGLPFPHWHTLRDTPENCSPETLRQVGTLVLDFLYDYKW